MFNQARVDRQVLFLGIAILTIIVMVLHYGVLFLFFGFSNPIGMTKASLPCSLRQLVSPTYDECIKFDLPRISRWVDPFMWPLFSIFLYTFLILKKPEGESSAKIFFGMTVIMAMVTTGGCMLLCLPFGIAGFFYLFVGYSVISLPLFALIWLICIGDLIYSSLA